MLPHSMMLTARGVFSEDAQSAVQLLEKRPNRGALVGLFACDDDMLWYSYCVAYVWSPTPRRSELSLDPTRDRSPEMLQFVTT